MRFEPSTDRDTQLSATAPMRPNQTFSLVIRHMALQLIKDPRLPVLPGPQSLPIMHIRSG